MLFNPVDVTHTNAKASLDGTPVPTFQAWRLDTGEQITVDVRTFDETTMTKDAPAPVKSAGRGKSKDDSAGE